DQLAALRAAALVEDHGRHVLDVHVDQAEHRHLEDRQQQHELQRAAVAQDLEQLLAEHGAQAAHAASFPASAAARRSAESRVRRTNTSSSEGTISRTCTPAPSSPVICASGAPFATSRWSALPKIVSSCT